MICKAFLVSFTFYGIIVARYFKYHGHNLFSAENVACKEELKRVTIEKTKLAHELEALQQDTRKIAVSLVFIALLNSVSQVVKEWRKMDTELYEESRKWFTKEIADRDNKLSHINLEIKAKELQWKNDELGLTQQLKKVQADLLALEEKLNVKQEALERVTANIEQVSVLSIISASF